MFLRSVGTIAILALLTALHAQQPATSIADRISAEMQDLTKMRGNTEQPEIATRRRGLITQIALDIRSLPVDRKVGPIIQLANLATEGDCGREALQEVTTTYAEALRESPNQSNDNSYLDLARLIRYEHMNATVDNPRMATAIATLVAEERDIQRADFTATDLKGKSWTLKQLRGKVVLLNFWATWCPPCVEEIPALKTLNQKFEKQGLVILAIANDDAMKVANYVAEHNMTYPVLLDPDHKISDRFHVQGIPRSLIFDRQGKLVAQANDGRTQRQFLELLSQAGLH